MEAHNFEKVFPTQMMSSMTVIKRCFSYNAQSAKSLSVKVTSQSISELSEKSQDLRGLFLLVWFKLHIPQNNSRALHCINFLSRSACE